MTDLPDMEEPPHPGAGRASEKLAYTVGEAARAIGLSKSTVFEMLKDGRLRGLKLGHRRLIRRTELEAVLDAAEAQTARAA